MTLMSSTPATTVSGPSLSAYVAEKDKALDEEMRGKLGATKSAMEAMVSRAETKEAYDQMIAEDNREGNETVQAAIDGLIAQTRTIERIVAALNLGDVALEGSDSLDNPNAVFK